MGEFVCWGGVSKLAFGIINFSEISRGSRVWTTQTYKQKHSHELWKEKYIVVTL